MLGPVQYRIDIEAGSGASSDHAQSKAYRKHPPPRSQRRKLLGSNLGYGLHGRHNREYTIEELVELAENTGLRVVKTRSLDAFPTDLSKSAKEMAMEAISCCWQF